MQDGGLLEMSDMGNCMSMHQVISIIALENYNCQVKPLLAAGVAIGDGDQNSRRSDMVFSGDYVSKHIYSDVKLTPLIQIIHV